MLLRSPLIEDGSKLVIGHDDVSVDLRDAVYVIEQPPQDGGYCLSSPRNRVRCGHKTSSLLDLTALVCEVLHYFPLQ